MNDLDSQFRSASASLHAALDSIDVPTPPSRQPRSSWAPLAAAAALITVLAVGGFVATRRSAPRDVITSSETVRTDQASPTNAPEPYAATTTPIEGTPQATTPLITDSAPQPISVMPRPGLDQATIEPDFGTSITRITDSPSGTTTAPVASGTQAFNADGSRLLLYRTGTSPARHVVFDTDSWTEVAELDLMAATDIEDIFWDPVDPDLLRFVNPNTAELIEIDVASGTRRVAHTFDGCESAGFGNTSGTPSAHTATIVIVCATAAGADWIAHDVVANTDIARRPAIATSEGSFDAPLTMLSGNGFVLIDDERVIVLDAELEPTAITPEVIVSSGAVGLDQNGSDVLVATVFNGDPAGTAVMVNLATGAVNVVTGQDTGYPYPPTGHTMSPAAAAVPWLVAITTSPGSSRPLVTEVPEALADEVLLVDIASRVTTRLAHHRMADADVFDNWSTSYVALSPDGSTVIFSSNWGGDAVDTFRIQLT